MGSFAKKDMINKYGQKLFDSAKKFETDAKTVSKRANQKTAEATGDLVGHKIADQIISVSKKSSKKLLSQNEDKIEILKEIYIYIQKKRQQIIDELRLA